MRTFNAVILTLSLASLQAQLKTINPQTFPLLIAATEIFKDGSAYFVGSNYLVKCSDIENPVQAEYEYIFIGDKEFIILHCSNPRNCLAKAREYDAFGQEITRWYRTFNGGNSWQKTSQNFDHVAFIKPNFIVSDRNSKLRASADWGRNWTYFDTVRRYRVIGRENGSALVWNEDSNWVHKLRPTNFQLLFDVAILGSNRPVYDIMPNYKGYLVSTDSAQIYQVSTSPDTAYRVFKLDNFFRFRTVTMAKFGDTLIFKHRNLTSYSLDNGRTWSLDSTVLFDPRRLKQHNGQLFDFSTTRRAGSWRLAELNPLAIKSSAGHQLGASNSGLIPFGNKHLYLKMQVTNNQLNPKGVILNDTGKTTATMDLPNRNLSWNLIAFADSLHGVAGDFFSLIPERDDTLYYTADGGNTWQSRAFKDTGAFAKRIFQFVYPASQKCAIALNSNREMLFFDAQLNWQKTVTLPNSVKGGIRAIHFSNCNKGAVVTDDGLYYTSNAGATFTEVSNIPFNERVRSYTVTDSSVLLGTDESFYAADSLNGIYRKVSDFKSTFRALGYWIMPNHSIFHFWGQTRKINYSSDSGKTFQAAPFPSTRIIDVKQTRDSTFLLTGAGGVLHRLYVKDSLILNIKNHTGIGLSAQPPVSSVYFFPNPARASVQLRFGEPGARTITLTNMSGVQVLQKKTAHKKEQINVETLAPGLYILNVKMGAQSKTFKILVAGD